MSSQPDKAKGIVLFKEETRNHFFHYRLLSPQAEWLNLYYRVTKGKVHLDLFDVIECDIKPAKQSTNAFLQSFVVLRKFNRIGLDYKRFEAASIWARILMDNALLIQQNSHIWQTTIKALIAWEQETPPEPVLFKCLYILARDEGYPVKEDWFHKLSSKVKPTAQELIQKPIEDIQSEPSDIQESLEALLHWLQSEVDIKI